ncbi:MAG: amino acid adenylation domain-containing protein [Campylobacter sp.]|uniref:amino acid adenylation domain-containing protein n=2 Tax=Campylobacter sp. TaxID=205 RepID=UPI001AFDDF51|nr:amino acid adenylation domain-containing protein [Campylobacter sp.]MBO7155138.1 amino acid adenylation domain-containing protein [Campylobacter sp.]
MLNSAHKILSQSAKAVPQKLAFITPSDSITYISLDEKSSALATQILNLNINKSPILIILPKGIEAIISFFGVLKSGNFYTIIDENMPLERINKIIRTLCPTLLITSKDLALNLDLLTIFIDDLPDFKPDQTILNSVKIIDTDLAYTLFTSGSTGEPKGVSISHKSLIDFTIACVNDLAIDESHIIANQAPFYFDLSVFDIYVNLFARATAHILPKSIFAFPLHALEYLQKNRVTTIIWVPSVLVYFANSNALNNLNSSLKMIIACGEMMPTKQLNIWIKAIANAKFYNLYGPTESTLASSYYMVNRELRDDEILPIGKAFSNTELLVFDEDMKLITKPNIKGELYIRGSGLSHGYYNDPVRTAKAFIQNPLQSSYAEPIYKTGDIVAYDEFGDLIYYGRQDSQIKLNGFRIELGEIETALGAHPDIYRVACIFKDYQIIAFYESTNVITNLKEFLKSKLQEYMIPRKFIHKSKFKLNQNGKIDKEALKNE